MIYNKKASEINFNDEYESGSVGDEIDIRGDVPQSLYSGYTRESVIRFKEIQERPSIIQEESTPKQPIMSRNRNKKI